ncbi:T9SS type A sorting domain-containing protein [Dyadobacter sp. SG02]|uniref:T9SS type A sorting domain-containing protein n=1 Tax=Dyadobacter sp. SG02 TaxID=1855291 RepID=UPI001E64807A|nr:T9SS type A sorting domain-containing protein [Dyadobacter sp. SG02]
MKDAIGNWHVSAAINIGHYSSQLEGTEIARVGQPEEPGFELNAYPNPFTESFTIAFCVPQDNCHVQLEIMDIQGAVLKTVVNNPHAKGKWQYEVQGLPDTYDDILFCRLKVNESYTVKKLLRMGK